MAEKEYPVVFAPKIFDKLIRLVGDDFAEIDISIQRLLSRRPRHGVAFDSGLRAFLITPPGKRIVVVYDFDDDFVLIMDVFEETAKRVHTAKAGKQ